MVSRDKTTRKIGPLSSAARYRLYHSYIQSCWNRELAISTRSRKTLHRGVTHRNCLMVAHPSNDDHRTSAVFRVHNEVNHLKQIMCSNKHQRNLVGERGSSCAHNGGHVSEWPLFLRPVLAAGPKLPLATTAKQTNQTNSFWGGIGTSVCPLALVSAVQYARTSACQMEMVQHDPFLL